MPNISIRLPPEVERELEEEIRLTQRNRSELVREAVSVYLTQCQRARAIEAMRQAARVLYSDPEAKKEGIASAEQGLSEWLEGIEGEERAAGVDPDEPWWD